MACRIRLSIFYRNRLAVESLYLYTCVPGLTDLSSNPCPAEDTQCIHSCCLLFDAELQTGDVVISTRPIAADENIIKRITAMEGETVVFFRPGDPTPVPVKVYHDRR